MGRKRWIAAACTVLLLLTGCGGKETDRQVSTKPTSGYEVMSSEGQYFFLISVSVPGEETPSVVLRKLVRDKETKTAVAEKSYDLTDRRQGSVYCLTVEEPGDYELEASCQGCVTEKVLVVVGSQPMYFLPITLEEEGATEPTEDTGQTTETVTDPTEETDQTTETVADPTEASSAASEGLTETVPET